MATTKKSTGNRYPGVDSTPWKITGADGKRIGSDAYTGYKDAKAAAERYTNETGLYAGTARL
jgi:hypothetical protein